MKTVPLKARAALSQFESARRNLEAFEKEHAKVVEDYSMMREAYNSALVQMKGVYKDNHEELGPQYGDFKARSKVTVDGRKLYNLLGPDDAAPYLELRFVVLKPVYDRGIESGDISQEVAIEVETRGIPAIYGPKKA